MSKQLPCDLQKKMAAHIQKGAKCLNSPNYPELPYYRFIKHTSSTTNDIYLKPAKTYSPTQ